MKKIFLALLLGVFSFAAFSQNNNQVPGKVFMKEIVAKGAGHTQQLWFDPTTKELASGASATITLAAFGSTPNANGAALTGSALNLEPASATLPGGVTAGTQNLGGQKTLILNNAGISQQLILDNQQATPAIGYGSSLALAVNNVQKADLRVQIDSLGTSGADYAKVRLNAQNGGAMKIVYEAKMKNAGVDEISFFPEDAGVVKMSRRIVTPYTDVALTGNATLAAGYSTYVLTGTQILTDSWTVTMPPSASMLDGEVITISNSIVGVSGATLQLTANSGQTLLGFTGTASFANTVGFADRRAIQLMFKSGGTWITLAQY